MKQWNSIVLLGMMALAVAAPAGKLEVSQSMISYGILEEGPPVIKRIVLANRGSDILKIANVTTSCACTSTALGKRSLAPGESTELEITYNTFKYAGKFDKSITVFTGPDGKDQTIIRLMGYVDPIPMGVLEMEPRKAQVGVLNLGKENEVLIVIKNTGDAPLAISRIVSTKFNTAYFDADKQGELVIAAGSQRIVNFRIKPVQTGRFLDTIMIHSNARNDIGKGYKGLLAGEVRSLSEH